MAPLGSERDNIVVSSKRRLPFQFSTFILTLPLTLIRLIYALLSAFILLPFKLLFSGTRFAAKIILYTIRLAIKLVWYTICFASGLSLLHVVLAIALYHSDDYEAILQTMYTGVGVFSPTKSLSEGVAFIKVSST